MHVYSTESATFRKLYINICLFLLLRTLLNGQLYFRIIIYVVIPANIEVKTDDL